MRNFASCKLYSEMDNSFGSYGGGYSPPEMSEAERHIKDLEDNLQEHVNRQFKLFDFREIIKNGIAIRELRRKIRYHRKEFPEYYL